MQINKRLRYLSIGSAAVIASAALLFCIHAFFGFDLSDEGFFWHGSQLALKGAAPLRDFQSYEPGRYYWTAAVMWALRDDSNLTSRISCIAFGALGYAASAVLAIRETKAPITKRTGSLTLGLVTLLCIWTFPYHRVFDTVATAWIFNVAHYQITRVGWKSYLLSGAACGLIFFLGRNHSLYGLVAVTFAIAVSHLERKRSLLAFVAAITQLVASLATTAVLLFALLEVYHPGSAIGAVRYWVEFASSGKTNLEASLPLPWKTIQTGMSASQIEGHLITGMFVLIVLATAAAGSLLVLKMAWKGRTVNSIVTASVAGTVGYLHCMTSRPDLIHIANPLIPLIMGLYCFGITGKNNVYYCAGTVFAAYATVRAGLREQSIYQCSTKPDICGEIQMSKSHSVRAKEAISREIRFIEEWTKDTEFLALPAYSSVYARAGLDAPGWGLYASLKKSPRVENQIVNDIKKRDYSIVVLKRSNGDTDPSRTMPLAFDVIKKRYEMVAEMQELSVEVYKKRTKFLQD